MAEHGKHPTPKGMPMTRKEKRKAKAAKKK